MQKKDISLYADYDTNETKDILACAINLNLRNLSQMIVKENAISSSFEFWN